MVEVNREGQPLCRYCSRVATNRCEGAFIRGLYVCDRHVCDDCRPLQPSTADEGQQHEESGT